MKNILRWLFVIPLYLLFTGCGGGGGGGSTTDTTTPVITLNGSNPMAVIIGNPYNEPGATAVDNVDGEVEVNITGDVNLSIVGSYTITYTAKDSSNNTAIKTRIVNVTRFTCAEEAYYDSRIINGDAVDANDAKWSSIVALLWSGTDPYYDQICGGTLIHENWVLTAAHCVDGSENSPGEFYIGSKSYALDDMSDVTAVKRIIKHPGYDPDTYDNDIALLELKSSVTTVMPMVLDFNNPLEVEECTMVAGWGSTDYPVTSKSYPYELREVGVPLVSNDICNDFDIYNGDVTDNMICAGYRDGEYDSCYGDSGGPLIAEDNGTIKQIGIVSWGEGCALSGYPGIYTKVQNYIDFIDNYVPGVQ